MVLLKFYVRSHLQGHLTLTMAKPFGSIDHHSGWGHISIGE
jgi:hypothetical protein